VRITIQLTSSMRILVAVEAADFRKGIDGLAALCRSVLASDPFCGTALCQLNGVNAYDYLAELQEHAGELARDPQALDAVELPRDAPAHRGSQSARGGRGESGRESLAANRRITLLVTASSM